MVNKVCRICGESGEFYPQRRVCKLCCNAISTINKQGKSFTAYNAEYRRLNREKLREYNKVYMQKRRANGADI